MFLVGTLVNAEWGTEAAARCSGRVGPLRSRRRGARPLVLRAPYGLSPTLECDGGNDAATAAAVLAGGPDPPLPRDRRLPGARPVPVTSRRIDGEAQLCIA